MAMSSTAVSSAVKRGCLRRASSAGYQPSPCQARVQPGCPQQRQQQAVRAGSGPAQLHANPAQLPQSSRRMRVCAAAAAAAPAPLLSSPWGIWAALTALGAAGLWSEKTRVGKELSGPLFSTLVGLAASNLNIIPVSAPQYGLVNKFLLPLAVPLLLFTADLRRILTSTGRLLLSFCIGSVATVIGTLVAMKLLPLRSLGPDNWRVASALAARHIGGAVNYVAVGDALGMSNAAQAAGLAADNLLCAVYFSTLFQLARKIPPDPPEAVGEGAAAAPEAASALQGKPTIQVLEGSTALALSMALCWAGSTIAAKWGISGALIPIATALTVALATLAPSLLQPLVPSGEGIAAVLMHIFFATVGANASISAVISSCPALFVFCFIQISIHLGLTLGVGSALGFSRRELLLSSNANVGGPTTAAGMATAKGWRTSMAPCILIGTFGYAIATFICCALGVGVLQHM